MLHGCFSLKYIFFEPVHRGWTNPPPSPGPWKWRWKVDYPMELEANRFFSCFHYDKVIATRTYSYSASFNKANPVIRGRVHYLLNIDSEFRMTFLFISIFKSTSYFSASKDIFLWGIYKILSFGNLGVNEPMKFLLWPLKKKKNAKKFGLDC